MALGALLAAALLAAARPAAGPPDTALVEVGGTIVQQVPVDTTATLQVDGRLGRTVVRVEAGRARIVSSPCVHHVCVRRGWIDATGQAAACVPNGVVLRLRGPARGRAFDGVSR